MVYVRRKLPTKYNEINSTRVMSEFNIMCHFYAHPTEIARKRERASDPPNPAQKGTGIRDMIKGHNLRI